MALLGFAIRNSKTGFYMAQDGTFFVRKDKNAKLFETPQDAYKFVCDLRRKDIPAIVTEVVQED